MASTEPDDILASFLDYLEQTGLEAYDHQEEAILELYEGRNVILNTPTGSGKSLVALALQYKSLCQGRTSIRVATAVQAPMACTCGIRAQHLLEGQGLRAAP